MTREEAIKYLNEFILFKKISNTTEEEAIECFKLAIKALEQQPGENEKVIRIKKGTLKVRTGRYVIYDVEWLKEHFNTTEAKIYGQTSEDCISRKSMLEGLANIAKAKAKSDAQKSLMGRIMFFVEQLPPATTQAKVNILDEIKTEIERRCCITVGEEPAMTLYDIFQIIDKYKTESEAEE